MAPQPPQLRKNFGERTANHFAVFVPQPFRAIDKLAVGESHEVRAIDKLAVGESHEVCALIQTSLRFVCRAVCDA
ncbi:hypothetical protein ACRQKX_005316, partial [Escherichia coli]|nr:hypothetical protein [Escherichia coli]EJN4382976.1 hypothetical protein [Escherichia coli]EKQ6934852.1 hypothetical protein [Escherichia coli]EKQ6951274.1 hypothetical protein [Escherichia coli]EKQ6962044.1 hypothetical protein [Escherichia coli]